MNILAWQLLFGFGAVILVAEGSRLASAASVPAPMLAPVSARDLGMQRHQIARDDTLLWIFNGRGRCNLCRDGLTGFRGLERELRQEHPPAGAPHPELNEFHPIRL